MGRQLSEDPFRYALVAMSSNSLENLGMSVGALASHFAFHFVQATCISLAISGNTEIALSYAVGHILGWQWIKALPKNTSEARSLFLIFVLLAGLGPIYTVVPVGVLQLPLVAAIAFVLSPTHSYLSATLGIIEGPSPRLIQAHDAAGILGFVVGALAMHINVLWYLLALVVSASAALVAVHALEATCPKTTYLMDDDTAPVSNNAVEQLSAAFLIVLSGAYFPLIASILVWRGDDGFSLIAVCVILIYIIFVYLSSQIALSYIRFASGVAFAAALILAFGGVNLLDVALLVSVFAQLCHVEHQNRYLESKELNFNAAWLRGIDAGLLGLMILCGNYILDKASHLAV